MAAVAAVNSRAAEAESQAQRDRLDPTAAEVAGHRRDSPVAGLPTAVVAYSRSSELVAE